MRHIALVLAFSVLVSFGVSLASAESGDAKVYIVDMQRVITESIIGKAAQSDLQDDAKKRELKLEQMGAELKKVAEQVEKQASLLSKEALDQKKEEVVKKQKEMERAVQDGREAIARKRDEALKKVVEQAKKSIKEVSASKSYPFVIEKDPQMILYSDPTLDITDEVIKSLDSKKLSS